MYTTSEGGLLAMRLYYRLSSTYHDYNSNYVVDPTCQTAKNLPAFA